MLTTALIVLAVACGAACLIVAVVRRRRVGAGTCLMAGVLLFAVVFWVQSQPANNRPEEHESAIPGLPKRLEPEFGYVGSDECRSCHATEYESWHASYHRSMTQVATPESVVAPFDDVTLIDPRGWRFHLERQSDEFWIDMVDPDWERTQIILGRGRAETVADPPRGRRRVVMTTGSHHKQAFWVRSAEGEFLCRIPWTYRIDDARWIPFDNDYLTPPDADRNFSVWSEDCIECHSVAGQPRRNDRTIWDAHVAELGIACEACHGPGSEHVRHHRSTRRSDRTGVPMEGATLFNPATAPSPRAAQVCGQCHGMSYVKDHEQFLTRGHSFRPGDDLLQSREFLSYSDDPHEPGLEEFLRQNPGLLNNFFWPDNTIRVTGREFNDVSRTPCYQGGEFSCLSCHSMHRYQQPDDQLARQKEGNQACLQCHDEYGAAIAEHTHHAPDSTGSVCYNCHMPHTTYGLFKAVRSHRIDSPDAARSVRTGRPNACNLCHIDQTMAWTAECLTGWFGQSPVTLTEDEQTVSAAVLWLLRGDAAQRAVTAWHLGWPPAQQASGADWIVPYLAVLLRDPYSAVRNVAQRSLRTRPEFTDIAYDFLGPEAARRETSTAVSEQWRQGYSGTTGETILISSEGQLRQERLEQLLRQRDDRPVYVSE